MQQTSNIKEKFIKKNTNSNIINKFKAILKNYSLTIDDGGAILVTTKNDSKR